MEQNAFAGEANDRWGRNRPTMAAFAAQINRTANTHDLRAAYAALRFSLVWRFAHRLPCMILVGLPMDMYATLPHMSTRKHSFTGGHISGVLRLKRGGSEPRHSAMRTPKNRCQRSLVLELYVRYGHKVRNYIGCWSITANMPL